MKIHLSPAQVAALRADFEASMFGYQRTWAEAKHHRVRNITAARQIGVTWHFAREMFLDAAETGEPQIVLAGSPRQALAFRDAIAAWVAATTGVMLTGTPIRLTNGATLDFLGVGSRLAPFLRGNVLLDNYAWVKDTARAVVLAHQIGARYRRTYATSANPGNRTARAFWFGSTYILDCEWRNAVTIEDAAPAWPAPPDLPTLRREYGTDFDALFLCRWGNDE